MLLTINDFMVSDPRTAVPSCYMETNQGSRTQPVLHVSLEVRCDVLSPFLEDVVCIGTQDHNRN